MLRRSTDSSANQELKATSSHTSLIMMHQAYSKFTPLLDVPLGDKSSSKWFLGPWGRDDYMKQLQDFKRSKAFAPIESNWEKSCAQHLLRMYEQCVLTWVINKSKDQKSFETDMTGERVGPSLLLVKLRRAGGSQVIWMKYFVIEL